MSCVEQPPANATTDRVPSTKSDDGTSATSSWSSSDDGLEAFVKASVLGASHNHRIMEALMDEYDEQHDHDDNDDTGLFSDESSSSSSYAELVQDLPPVVPDHPVAPLQRKGSLRDFLKISGSDVVLDVAGAVESDTIPMSEIISQSGIGLDLDDPNDRGDNNIVDNNNNHNHDDLTALSTPYETLQSRYYAFAPIPPDDARLAAYFVPWDTTGYSNALTQAVRHGNLSILKMEHALGTNLQCCNRYGESILHTAARRGDLRVIKFLAGVASMRVCDDTGRTILHDACWAVEPNFDVIWFILSEYPHFLLLADRRGFTPLQYVPVSSYGQWDVFLNEHGEELATLLNKPENSFNTPLPKDYSLKQRGFEEGDLYFT